uniref:Dihydropyrimidinase like 5 n=1 Tax=Malurus cyaneus samueli TaxID=2593467 RepID=A0A8C5X3X1_9PASS
MGPWAQTPGSDASPGAVCASPGHSQGHGQPVLGVGAVTSWHSHTMMANTATMRILIKGGKVVNDDCTLEADVYIENGIIQQVGRELMIPGGAKVIDATGKLVIPGGIDTSTHFHQTFMNATCVDDFYHGTKAALVGGTTMIIGHVLPDKETSLLDAYEKCRSLADPKVCCDYALHMGITWWAPKVKAEMETLVREKGVNSFQMFMTYKDLYMLRDSELYQVLRACRDIGAIARVHAENGELVAEGAKEALDLGITGPEGIEISRPEEVGDAMSPSPQTHCPVYLVNVSSMSAGDVIAAAKMGGRWYDALGWVRCSTESSEGSGEAPSTLEVFWGTGRDPSQHILTPLWLQVGGKMDENRFVAVTSSNAAKIHNLYPRKGRIIPGADADVVVWDPEATKTISASTQVQGGDINLYENMRCHGVPLVTISRGRVVYENGVFMCAEGTGKFCPLRSFPDIAYKKLVQREKVRGQRGVVDSGTLEPPVTPIQALPCAGSPKAAPRWPHRAQGHPGALYLCHPECPSASHVSLGPPCPLHCMGWVGASSMLMVQGKEDSRGVLALSQEMMASTGALV